MKSGWQDGSRGRRGMAAIYTVVILVALCGLVSLGVDLGRVQLAKSELQTAADAAVRAAARGLAGSVGEARAAGVAVALANFCDGEPVALDSEADIEFGTWDAATRTFTALSGYAVDSATAVRITARRVEARGTAIPLAFARLVGKSTCDVHASAVATVQRASGGGFVGLNGITGKNGLFVASYNSGSNPDPNQASAGSKGMLGSNGTISVGNANTVRGDIQLGPEGSVSGSIVVSGSTRTLTEPLPAPEEPAWTPSANPGGIPQTYTVSSKKTLPGGTYWFTSLTINKDLSFSGPATVYVNGDITLNAALTAAGKLPANLKVYQLGTGRSFGDASGNGMDITAEIHAPGSSFVAKNACTIRGLATFGTMTFKNAADLFYDETIGAPGGQVVVSLVD